MKRTLADLNPENTNEPTRKKRRTTSYRPCRGMFAVPYYAGPAPSLNDIFHQTTRTKLFVPPGKWTTTHLEHLGVEKQAQNTYYVNLDKSIRMRPRYEIEMGVTHAMMLASGNIEHLTHLLLIQQLEQAKFPCNTRATHTPGASLKLFLPGKADQVYWTRADFLFSLGKGNEPIKFPFLAELDKFPQRQFNLGTKRLQGKQMRQDIGLEKRLWEKRNRAMAADVQTSNVAPHTIVQILAMAQAQENYFRINGGKVPTDLVYKPAVIMPVMRTCNENRSQEIRPGFRIYRAHITSAYLLGLRDIKQPFSDQLQIWVDDVDPADFRSYAYEILSEAYGLYKLASSSPSSTLGAGITNPTTRGVATPSTTDGMNRKRKLSRETVEGPDKKRKVTERAFQSKTKPERKPRSGHTSRRQNCTPRFTLTPATPPVNTHIAPRNTASITPTHDELTRGGFVKMSKDGRLPDVPVNVSFCASMEDEDDPETCTPAIDHDGDNQPPRPALSHELQKDVNKILQPNMVRQNQPVNVGSSAQQETATAPKGQKRQKCSDKSGAHKEVNADVERKKKKLFGETNMDALQGKAWVKYNGIKKPSATSLKKRSSLKMEPPTKPQKSPKN